MQEFCTETAYRNANELTKAELYGAIGNKTILQSTALAFDTQRQLKFSFNGIPAVMPFAECADGASNGSVRDIAILTRVGRATCFVIQDTYVDCNTGIESFVLSRAQAQKICKTEYLSQLCPGDIIPCTVTHVEAFGAFCDIGCGISALLPIDCMSISRISSPYDRLSIGQKIFCAIKNRDPQGRFVLSMRELLGTWSENVAQFCVGETVVGIVRSIESYGTFIELAPNLAGLAETCSELHAGQPVSVYIKNILSDKMKIKLVIVNKHLGQNIRFDLQYFLTQGHLDQWIYSTNDCRKQISTDFSCAQTL